MAMTVPKDQADQTLLILAVDHRASLHAPHDQLEHWLQVAARDGTRTGQPAPESR
jgi:hypothetical protein